jgi:hypothetical protein
MNIQHITFAFVSGVGASILLYLLRAFQIVTFFPGGILLITILFSIVCGLAIGLMKTRR